MIDFLKKTLNRVSKSSFLTIILLIALLWVIRGVLLWLDAFPFNADEAIVGLMAKHIVAGERPIFFYGQVYMGSLDAYLIALFFRLFGNEVIWIRIVQLILYSITIIEFYWFMLIAFKTKRAAFWGAIYLVFAPINLALYTTVSLGGYGEALALGMGAILISVILTGNARDNAKGRLWLMIGLGFVSGLGVWANALSLLFSVPAIIYYLLASFDGVLRFLKRTVIVFMSGVLGASLWLIGLLNHGTVLFGEMFGSAVSVEQVSFFEKVTNHLLSFVLFAPTVVLGLRPPWSVDLIFPVTIPLIIFAWVIVFYLLLKNKLDAQKTKIFWMILSVGIILFFGYIFTSFGVDPSGRYFLPFNLILAVIIGLASVEAKKKKPFIFGAILIMVYQTAGCFYLSTQDIKITTQFYESAQVNMESMDALITFLNENNTKVGYSNYWVSYPLSFRSDEEIIAVPYLPYHPDLRYTDRDSRIENYEKIVDMSDEVFYITTKNEALDEILAIAFRSEETQFDYIEIGDFHIYFNLSKTIRPQELVIYGLYAE